MMKKLSLLSASRVSIVLTVLFWIGLDGRSCVGADDLPPANNSAGDVPNPEAEQAKPPPKLTPPENVKRVDPGADLWIDTERGLVIMDGQVSLRRGPLEMFACTRNTKEHESVVVVDTRAFLVHAALLTIGAEPGAPVSFYPEYKAARGTRIDIQVSWRGKQGKWQTVDAREWVRDVRTEKAMTHDWVFAGSSFWTDEQSGRQFYQAEGGDFICVSNFSTAMLDLPVESTQSNEGLFFEAFTERVPPLGTRVRLTLKVSGEEQQADSE